MKALIRSTLCFGLFTFIASPLFAATEQANLDLAAQATQSIAAPTAEKALPAKAKVAHAKKHKAQCRFVSKCNSDRKHKRCKKTKVCK